MRGWRIGAAKGIAVTVGKINLKNAKADLRRCKTLQDLATAVRSLPTGDPAGVNILVPLAVELLHMSRVGGGMASVPTDAASAVRQFIEDALCSWLSGPQPPPMHLVAVLGALRELGGGLSSSSNARKPLRQLVSDPIYLQRAATTVVGAKSRSSSTSSPPFRWWEHDGGQLPALVSSLNSLGLKRSLGRGLGDQRLRKLLWPKEDEEALLLEHLAGICRSFGRGSRREAEVSGCRQRVASRASSSRYRSGSDEIQQAAEVSSAGAMVASDGDKEEGDSECVGDSAGLQTEDPEDLGEVVYQERLRSKSRFLYDLDFLNKELVAKGMEVSEHLWLESGKMLLRRLTFNYIQLQLRHSLPKSECSPFDLCFFLRCNVKRT